MNSETKKALLNHLTQFVTKHRKSLFKEILSFRTRHITVVMEDIYQSQNASAVLRTCDLTGIQDVHIIENKNQYDINPDVALGSSKWLNLQKYNNLENNTLSTYKELKGRGYKIIATTPNSNGYSLNDIPLNNKIALVFGTELTGLSKIAIENADDYLKIPMYGFTESYNISVSAALVLFALTEKLRNSDIQWQLSDHEKLDIELEWARKSINRSEIIENEFLKTLNT